MGDSKVIVIESDDDFTVKRRECGERLIVIDFHALWCGPCKMIAPKFNQLSLQYPDVAFLKVDVDKCEDTARQYQVTAMPTFKFEHQGKILATFSGADGTKLESKIRELSETVTSLHNAKGDPAIAPGMMDLEQFIIEKDCLNESDDHPFKYVFEENKDLYLESDCDPELLMSYTFNQVIRLHSIKLQGPSNGHAPKTMKLFINQPTTMDFDGARDGSPLQEISLTPEDVSEGKVIKLKFVKLQTVNNLTLFIPDNQGGEETTIIERIVLYGKTVSTTNMDDFKRVSGKKGESH
uniref:Thioredoxin-like protein 1 n=1 Tax=Phallusia mammillata TaxID=59560 RepID=A0A6F9DW90_9ASCI|nr:thioredoxin-like protein 1 [Phallusia mammillata]